MAVGIDLLENSVEEARELLSRRGAVHATAVHASLDEYAFATDQYDVVLFMNSLGYSPDPHGVIERVGAMLPVGGRVIVKDYDLESILISPVSRHHWRQLLEAAAQADQADNPLPFTNFFGRRVPFLASAYPFRTSETIPWTNVMAAPFTGAQRDYIWGNIESLLQQARDMCRDDVSEYFATEFAADGGSFFDRDEALFVENEYVSVLTK